MPVFVYSVRASALRFFGVLVLSLAALVTLIAFVPTYVPASASVKEEEHSFDNMSTDAQRAAFLKGYGWEVSETPAESAEVTVPARFDTVYEDYNTLQRGQGLDLSRYRGKKVMRYTYTVENYPDYDGTVYASLLLYKNRIIGGDICSADASGFLHGFEKP